jgi:hypothetical protein
MTTVDADKSNALSEAILGPKDGASEWSTVDKKASRSLRPQHTITKQDLGKDTKSSEAPAAAAAVETNKKKGEQS